MGQSFLVLAPRLRQLYNAGKFFEFVFDESYALQKLLAVPVVPAGMLNYDRDGTVLLPPNSSGSDNGHEALRANESQHRVSGLSCQSTFHEALVPQTIQVRGLSTTIESMADADTYLFVSNYGRESSERVLGELVD